MTSDEERRAFIIQGPDVLIVQRTDMLALLWRLETLKQRAKRALLGGVLIALGGFLLGFVAGATP